MGFSKEKNGFHKDYSGNLIGSGNYKNGKRVGKWKIYETSNNNRSYVSQIGYYKDGLKHGEWISYLDPKFGYGKDVIQTIENYENGHVTKVREYHENGQLRSSCLYKDNKRHGEYKSYYRNGQISSEVTYVNGLKQGEDRSYHFENGELECIETYKDGKGNFEGKNSYFKDGKLFHVNEYENGREIRYQQYYEDGSSVTCEVDGELDHGKRIYYSKDGQIEEIRNYKQGVLHGEFQIFNESGRPVLFKTYRDGILHGEYRRYSGVGFPWVDIVNYENGLKQGECRNYVGEKYDVLTSICYFVDDEIQDETKEYNPDGSFKGYGSLKANIEKREKEKLELQVG